MKRIVLLVCVFVYFSLRVNVWGDTIPPTLIGEVSISQYIDENTDWEFVFGEGLTQLWVDVKFEVYKDGTLGKLQAHSMCAPCDVEIENVLKATNNHWIPCKIDGQPVDCAVSFRVPFMVSNVPFAISRERYIPIERPCGFWHTQRDSMYYAAYKYIIDDNPYQRIQVSDECEYLYFDAHCSGIVDTIPELKEYFYQILAFPQPQSEPDTIDCTSFLSLYVVRDYDAVLKFSVIDHNILLGALYAATSNGLFRYKDFVHDYVFRFDGQGNIIDVRHYSMWPLAPALPNPTPTQERNYQQYKRKSNK